MSSTASLIALIASTAMSGISVVRGVNEDISGMNCSIQVSQLRAAAAAADSHVSKQAIYTVNH